MRISSFFRQRFDVGAMHESFAFTFSVITANEISGVAHLLENDSRLEVGAQLLIFHASVVTLDQTSVSPLKECVTDVTFFVVVRGIFQF